MAKTDKKFTIRGILCKTSNGEDNDLLGIMPTEGEEAYRVAIFAELASDYRWSHKFATVSYYIADKPGTEEELREDFLTTVFGGNFKAAYGAHYSEMTGYLWTDEEFNVGGHNLIQELKGNLGKFLHMNVVLSNTKPKKV